MPIKDVIGTVADCVSVLRGMLSQDCLKSFRSRARDIPALMFSRGLAYAIVYVASRSSADVFKEGLGAEACEEPGARVKACEKLGRVIADKYKKDEECGYALYGALLAYAMKVYGAAKKPSEDPFKELVKTALEDPTANARALEIAEWIKRFAEAYIEERRT